MSGKVFVLQNGETLVALKPAQFSLEEDFQKLLTKFPELLSGELINSTAPRRWLFITQEKSIPSEEGGGGRWAIDHLFLDQDGIPTFVEVKRKSDTRLRREVVGQMLDYAANAVVYWPVEDIRSEFERNSLQLGRVPTEDLEACLGPREEFESFWQQVKTNLLAGRVRLLFVADKIPSELQRIVEFLNLQMDPAEVLALELQRFEGEGVNTIVPVVYGHSQEAQGKKGGKSARDWTEAEALQLLATNHGQNVADVASKILEVLRADARIWLGRGAREASIRASYQVGDGEINPINLWSYGKLEINFKAFANSPLTDGDRQHFLSLLNHVDGVSLPHNTMWGYASIPLRLFEQSDRFERLIAATSWLARALRDPEK